MMRPIVEAFVGLVEEIPCCTCCGSDEGYTEAVKDALNIVLPSLTEKEKTTIQAAFGKEWSRYKPSCAFWEVPHD